MNRAEQPSPDHERLIRKVGTIAALTEQDKADLASLPLNIKLLPADVDIVREGERPTHCCLLLDGFACRYKILPNGGRQIFSFHIPGDIVDLQSLYLEVMDHGVGTVVPTRVAFIPHAAITDLIHRNPTLLAAFWRDTLIDAAVFREWLAGVGRRTAHQRIAHLLCELAVRLQSVGLSDHDGYELRVTQAELGDSLGLSTVHVNRVLQDLRSEGLIASRGRFLAIKDWDGLKAAGEFDPAYLHLLQPPA